MEMIILIIILFIVNGNNKLDILEKKMFVLISKTNSYATYTISTYIECKNVNVLLAVSDYVLKAALCCYI